MPRDLRHPKHARSFDGLFMDHWGAHRGFWYESEEEAAKRLEEERRKAALFRWVRRQMKRRLTARERRCLELRYLESLRYAEIAVRAGCTRIAAEHAVARALKKLRTAAAQDPSVRRLRRRPKHG